MTGSLRIPRSAAVGFAILVLFAIGLYGWLLRLEPLSSFSQELAIAVLLDMIIFWPLLYYWFILRKKGKTIGSVLPVIAVGAVTAYFAIPYEIRQTLGLGPTLLLPIEASVLLYEFLLFMRIRREYIRVRAATDSRLESLRLVVRSQMGDTWMGRMVNHEASTFGYALSSWRRKPRVTEGTQAFAYYEQSNGLAFTIMLTLVLTIEGIGLHVLVHQWSPAAAWVLSVGNLYLIMLFVADCRASRLNPIVLKEDGIRLRYGLRITADFTYADIAGIEAVRDLRMPKEEEKYAVDSVFDEANVVLDFIRPIPVVMWFGIRKEVTRLYLRLDQPKPFVEALLMRVTR